MRTRLCDRVLPDYTRAEERFNMITHIVGGGLGVAALIACVAVSALSGNVWGIASSVVYGMSMIALYTMSSIYHGLRAGTTKKVFQVLDHCAIYVLIAGTYTPIALSAIRPVDPLWGFLLFGAQWCLVGLAVVFTAIDLERYKALSLSLDFVMGYLVLIAVKPAIAALTWTGFLLILSGGVLYTMGAVLYGLGRKIRFMHSIFHLFVLAGSALQLYSILRFAL